MDDGSKVVEIHASGGCSTVLNVSTDRIVIVSAGFGGEFHAVKPGDSLTTASNTIVIHQVKLDPGANR